MSSSLNWEYYHLLHRVIGKIRGSIYGGHSRIPTVGWIVNKLYLSLLSTSCRQAIYSDGGTAGIGGNADWHAVVAGGSSHTPQNVGQWRAF